MNRRIARELVAEAIRQQRTKRTRRKAGHSRKGKTKKITAAGRIEEADSGVEAKTCRAGRNSGRKVQSVVVFSRVDRPLRRTMVIRWRQGRLALTSRSEPDWHDCSILLMKTRYVSASSARVGQANSTRSRLRQFQNDATALVRRHQFGTIADLCRSLQTRKFIRRLSGAVARSRSGCGDHLFAKLLHFPASLATLEASKHVFCEKPHDDERSRDEGVGETKRPSGLVYFWTPVSLHSCGSALLVTSSRKVVWAGFIAREPLGSVLVNSRWNWFVVYRQKTFRRRRA